VFDNEGDTPSLSIQARAVGAGETAGVLPEDGTPGGLPKSSRLARPVRKRPRDWEEWVAGEMRSSAFLLQERVTGSGARRGYPFGI
jgi:hypothetical protein